MEYLTNVDRKKGLEKKSLIFEYRNMTVGFWCYDKQL